MRGPCGNKAQTAAISSLTASGMFSPAYLRQAIDAVGVDRILFSTDYPFQYRPGGDARRFVEDLELDAADKAKFAHANWERLTAGRFLA